MKKNFYLKSIIDIKSTIKDAIENLNNTDLQICLVCKDKKLIGTLTDGDIRRGLIKGMTLETKIEQILNKKFIFLSEKDSFEKASYLMNLHKIHQIPVVDKNFRLKNLFLLDSNKFANKKENPVVIMAGGFGKRLLPRTKNCPKPLLPVSGKPLLEHILNQFKNEGFVNIFISIHYLGGMIKDYFGNGKGLGLNINYIEEKTPLGTAGSLSLLKEETNQPIIVCNGDIMAQISFSNLLEYHTKENATATMAVRSYIWQHPFGVVSTKGIVIENIDEKPKAETFVNAGMYVFDSSIKKFLNEPKTLDIPKLFEMLMRNKKKTIIYPLHEEWLDIGDAQQYEKAQSKIT